MVQVGRFTAPAGLPVTAQVRDTLPVKPPVGVTVMVDVTEPPAEIEGMLAPVSVKDALPVPPPWIVYAALATSLLPRIGLIAMLLMVSFEATEIGAVYLVDEADGAEPSVV
jgi:hypothetical protein